MLINLSLAIFVVGSIWLSYIDVRIHRLPNIGVGVLTATLLVLWVLAGANGSNIIFAFSYFVCLFLLHVLSRQQLGLGDVKYAFSVGLVTSYFTQDLLILCLATFGCAAAISILGIISRRLTAKSKIAFGPFMTFGALLAIAWAR